MEHAESERPWALLAPLASPPRAPSVLPALRPLVQEREREGGEDGSRSDLISPLPSVDSKGIKQK